jgi:hypothetical protein
VTKWPQKWPQRFQGRSCVTAEDCTSDDLGCFLRCPLGDVAVHVSSDAKQRNELRNAVDTQARLSLLDAISQYVEAVSGQHGDRLEALLARTGLNGRDPITGAEAARSLGVSHQRMCQIVQQLHRAKDRGCPSAGIWMPQLDAADQNGWPNSVTPSSKSAIQGFFVDDGA